MGNLIPKPRVGGPFEKACSGKGMGMEVTHKCTGGHCVPGMAVPETYEDKKVKCGATYTEVGAAPPLTTHIRRKLLVEDSDCSGICANLGSIPVIGNIISPVCESIIWAFRVGGFLLGILMIVLTIFLIWRKYYKTSVVTGMTAMLSMLIGGVSWIL